MRVELNRAFCLGKGKGINTMRTSSAMLLQLLRQRPSFVVSSSMRPPHGLFLASSSFSSSSSLSSSPPSSSSSKSSSSSSSSSSSWKGGLSASALALSVGFLVASSSPSGLLSAKDRPPPELVPKDVVLYQYQACPFCNKVKAYLDYYDIPYRVVEVNPLSKKELKWSEYRKVPVLMVDGQQLNDSSVIISLLDAKIHPNKTNSVNDASSREEEEKWRRWVDEHLVHVLAPNIYRSPSEALESFDYITTTGKFSTTERMMSKYVGAGSMYFISKRLKKRHNITDERVALYEAAEVWVTALNNRDFMGLDSLTFTMDIILIKD